MWKLETEGLEIEPQPMWRCVFRQPASFQKGSEDRGDCRLSLGPCFCRGRLHLGQHWCALHGGDCSSSHRPQARLSCSASVDSGDWCLSMAGTSATSASSSPGRVCVTTGRTLRSTLQLSNRIGTAMKISRPKRHKQPVKQNGGFQQHHVSEDAR